MSTTYAPQIHTRRPHVNVWLVAVIGLTAALVALGAWVIVDRYAGGNTATENTTSLMDDLYAASSAQDAHAVSAVVAPNVVLWSNGTTISGRKAFVNEVMTTPGLQMERTAPVTVEGDFASTFLAFTVPGVVNRGLTAETVQIKNGKIYRIWDFGIGVTPPFTSTAAVTVAS